ncbi:MAG: 23S rRNA pseudouridine(1911/1915/1917) synthase RluD [Cellvibrionaceae bacterium]|nr:23S rRNA pseudouridine(1911/1915/1917) synthase RluD [Cellvibrionaceae bacterium]
MKQQISQQSRISLELSGQRLDQVAVQLFPQFSRARLQEWIKSGQITLAGKAVKPNTKVTGGEVVQLEVELRDEGDWEAEDLGLNIVYEDEDLLVIDKPADLVVHPAAGNEDGTLLNGLLHHLPQLQQIPRAGIVHRLDKDTTGLMVVAKNLEAQNQLVQQLQARTVSRQYVAVVVGAIPPHGHVDAPLGRDPFNRIKMAVVKSGGKEAITHFHRLARLGPMSLVRLKLETGRTHQIRVHMAHLGFSLLGDPLYGRQLPRLVDLDDEAMELIVNFPRQALHAEQLSLQHPRSGETCTWQSPWPDDFAELVRALGGRVHDPS